jgi:hypothetical protein
MGKTDPTAARHKQQSMVIVPFRSTGIKGEQSRDSQGTERKCFIKNLSIKNLVILSI